MPDWKKQLPRFELEKSFQEKIDEAKAAMIGLEASDLAREMAREQRKKTRLEEKIKSHNVRLEACSQLLVEALSAQTMTSIKTEAGETVYISDELYSTTEDREAVFAYIKKARRPDLLTVHAATLNRENKERLQNGETPLPGTKVFLKTRARVRSARKEESDDE